MKEKKKGNKEQMDKQKTKSKMTDLNLTISIIMLNVSSLNTIIKKAEIVRLDNKARFNYMLPIRNAVQTKRHK